MLILQTLGGIGSRYGGPSVSVPQLCHAVSMASSVDVTLLIPAEPGEQAVDELRHKYRIKTLPYWGTDRLRITLGLADAADKLLINNASIVHCHGLWMYPQWSLGKLAIRRRVPLVISPRGMLQDWAQAQNRLTKRILVKTLLRQHVKCASLYHALSRQELGEIRDFGVQCPIAVIPNGIDIPPSVPIQAVDTWRRKFPNLAGNRFCLFLSRLHPKKNLEGLLEAWALLSSDNKLLDWHLMIAGEGTEMYLKTLHEKAVTLNIADRVSFLGCVYGSEKMAVLAAADIFVLPSFSEGFSMAVLEAAAASLPVVMTEFCNFPELIAAGGAVIAQPSAESLAITLRETMLRSDNSLRGMGAAGANLVRSNYSWQEIGRSMLEVYRWLLDGGTKPSSVQL